MKINEHNLPKEWIELVKVAMKSNITKENFKKFLKERKEKRKNI
jgi:hypothetical protein